MAYSTPGTKSASVNVTSGNQSASQNCNNTITVSNPAPQPMSLSGSGQQATQQFELQAGLSVFTYSYSGSGNFIAYLMDNNGNEITSVASDRKFERVNSGKHSNGWFISHKRTGQRRGRGTIPLHNPDQRLHHQPLLLMATTSKQHRSFTFRADCMSSRQATVGLATLLSIFSTKTETRLIQWQTQLVPSNGSQAEGIDTSGIYLLSVESSGSWTISIQ